MTTKQRGIVVDPLGDIHVFSGVLIGCGVDDDYVVCRDCIYNNDFPLQCQYRREHNLEILVVDENGGTK